MICRAALRGAGALHTEMEKGLGSQSSRSCEEDPRRRGHAGGGHPPEEGRPWPPVFTKGKPVLREELFLAGH